MDGQNDTRGIRLTGTDQQEHDTLAELFLGDAPFAPEPMSGSADDDDRPGAHQNKAALGAGAKGQPDQSFGEHVGYDGSAIRAAVADESGDAHADRPVIEIVVLGHLPVRASLWVRQYACQSARKRSEPVALLRSAGDSVALDLITGGERSEV
ncbi:MAG: hypothetical protein AAGA55_11975, partial [Planctomycetota bacterium]